jgi:hypothetical protein
MAARGERRLHRARRNDLQGWKSSQQAGAFYQKFFGMEPRTIGLLATGVWNWPPGYPP